MLYLQGELPVLLLLIEPLPLDAVRGPLGLQHEQLPPLLALLLREHLADLRQKALGESFEEVLVTLLLGLFVLFCEIFPVLLTETRHRPNGSGLPSLVLVSRGHRVSVVLFLFLLFVLLVFFPFLFLLLLVVRLDRRHLLVQPRSVEVPVGYVVRVLAQRLDAEAGGVEVFDLLVDVLGLEAELAELVEDVDAVAEGELVEVEALLEQLAAFELELEVVLLGLLTLR